MTNLVACDRCWFSRGRHPNLSVVSTLAGIILTIVMIPSVAHAKHRYFANIHALTNYADRCLGIGWSDGYHAPGGWTVSHPVHHRHRGAYGYPYQNNGRPLPRGNVSPMSANYPSHNAALPRLPGGHIMPALPPASIRQQPAIPQQSVIGRGWPSSYDPTTAVEPAKRN